MTVQMEHVSQLVLASSALYGAAVGGARGAGVGAWGRGTGAA